jgi:polar amino acid transport system substrate-binding protein
VKPTKRLFSIAIAALLASAAVQAQTALDDVLKSKTLKVAIPTDSAPYGYVGTDLKPIGLDIDMANYIGKKLGVAVELVPVTSANRIPALQTRKADLVISTLGKNAEREKVIDFTIAYSPFFQAVFGPKTLPRQELRRPGRQVRGRDARRDGRPGTGQGGPALHRHQTLRGQQRHHRCLRFAGQVQFVALGASVAGNMMAKNPQLDSEYKLLLKDSPNFIGVAKGEDKLRTRVNEIIAEAKKNGDIDTMAKKWLGRPAGDLPL